MLLHGDCIELIKNIENQSVDLILTDPPYLISKDSCFRNCKQEYSKGKYGKLSIDFGDWDRVEVDWNYLFEQYYRVLKKGGTLIIFYDMWKISELKKVAEKYKFKQGRICQWQKTNPVPVNSKINYLSNAIEYFVTFIKGKNPTFNSQYDNGVYRYPICKDKDRFHPTQKPVQLINDLILKHSNSGDLVLDTFAGSGTTAISCIQHDRNYIIMERDEKYFNLTKNRIKNIKNICQL